MAKILVADDNSNIQKMVGLALKDQGIDVVAVGNGEAAVRKISDIRPDLVLADVFMPVRNGYEVCRYVKEDSSLAHIPVILLVGAFDPLDEQEAQRVGADGVLKKPFVPPDPLISMVKSALQRAGIPLGPATAAPEKTPAMPKRSTADLLSGGMGTKLTPVVPEKLPEISPQPLEEFPTAAPHLKIAAGSEPLAFGSLLDTSDSEDMAITAKPMINLAQGAKWNEESDEVEEEKEEGEEAGGGWRPGGLDEVIERAAQPEVAAAPDWRDEAFHGNSPAKSFSATQWVPAVEQTESAEAAESHAVAVATVPKPADSPVPFAGDAWAAAMAAGVEDKLAEVVAPVTPFVPEAEAAPELHAAATQKHVTEVAPEVREQATEQIADVAPGIDGGAGSAESAASSFEQAAVSEPANWAAAPETAWESEAKKAALLASTWDAPKPFAVDETQEVPAYAAEPVVEHTEALVETPAQESPYSTEPIAAHEAEGRVEAAVTEAVVVSEAQKSEVENSAGFPADEAKSLEHTWEPAAPGAVEMRAEEPAAEESRMEASHVEEPAAVAPPVEERAVMSAPAEEAVPEPEVAAKQAEPDMDELVARVLGKLNPEVLQRVTREILKPVIEAIVRDEINSKKS